LDHLQSRGCPNSPSVLLRAGNEACLSVWGHLESCPLHLTETCQAPGTGDRHCWALLVNPEATSRGLSFSGERQQHSTVKWFRCVYQVGSSGNGKLHEGRRLRGKAGEVTGKVTVPGNKVYLMPIILQYYFLLAWVGLKWQNGEAKPALN
jgi:hypothetical protein